MPSLPENKVTTVVIELEPGSVYVKIIEPKPAPGEIELYLRRTIDDWFSAHPQFVIDRAQAIGDHGEMQGIQVWYHVKDHQPQPTNPEPEPPPQPTNPEPPQQPTSLCIEVHNEILHQVSKEYIEAVVEDAMGIWRSYPDHQETLVAINPRKIAVILDRHANRGAVFPVRLMEPVVDASIRMELQTWLESPPARFFVMLLPGSWFVSHEIEAKRIKLVEPSFMRTNMTYDTGPRPQE
jgi:hypothetical protein